MGYNTTKFVKRYVEIYRFYGWFALFFDLFLCCLNIFWICFVNIWVCFEWIVKRMDGMYGYGLWMLCRGEFLLLDV